MSPNASGTSDTMPAYGALTMKKPDCVRVAPACARCAASWAWAASTYASARSSAAWLM
ncbi:MAG: hypothetical protein H7306_14500 [Bacteriovorax sp.]|nr:hypothetical protein [Rhizobacter sp.]